MAKQKKTKAELLIQKRELAIRKNELLFNSLPKRYFDPMETYRILKTRPTWLWSWGFRNVKIVTGKLLFFRVSGHHHKGYVAITLGWDDTYIVSFISIRWQVKETFYNVYVEDLLELLDTKIERRAEYDLTVK